MPNPILYAPNGQPVAFELTGEEKYTELLLVAFGLFSGYMAKSGELAAQDEAHGGKGHFLSAYCGEVATLVGVKTLEARFPGLRVNVSNEAGPLGQKEEPQPGPRLVEPEP